MNKWRRCSESQEGAARAEESDESPVLEDTADVVRLDGRAALQVLLDLGRVLAVELVDLLVEAHVPLVDEVDIRVRLVRALTTVALALLDPFQANQKRESDSAFTRELNGIGALTVY